MKKLTGYIFASAVMMILLAPNRLAAQDSLGDYLKQAAEANPGLRARFNEYMASLERIPQAGALPDPQLAFGYFISPVETRMGPQLLKISASQMFPWFGTLKARENLSVMAAKSSYEQFAEARSKLFYDVKAAYYDLYFNQKAIENTALKIDILRNLRNLAVSRFESGLVSAVDELRLKWR
ncbi:MAG: TolC family protein [Bacteroidales bacterium]